jgi:hypothetical protein
MGSRITETERTQPKAEREPGGNMRGVNTDRPMVLLPLHGRQQSNNGRFMKKEGAQQEDERCFHENINKGNAVTKAQTYGDCQ